MVCAEPEPLPGYEEDEVADGRRPRVACRLCGRPLVDREARLWGLGEECRAKLGERTAPLPPEVEVEQEALPGL